MVAALSRSSKYCVHCFGAASYSSFLTFMSAFGNVCISSLCSQPSIGLESSTPALEILSAACQRDAGGLSEEQPRRVRKEQQEAQA